MTDLRQRTPSQLRMLLTSYIVEAAPVKLTVEEKGRQRQSYDVELVGMAQEELREADPFSERGSLLVCRFYATKHLLVVRLAHVAELEPLQLYPTDPNHPDFEPEPQVVKPIPKEAMDSRRRRTANKHDQL